MVQESGFSLAGSSAGSHKPAIKALAGLCSLVEPRILLQAHEVVGRIFCRLRTEGPIFSLSTWGNSQFLEAPAVPCHGPSPPAVHNMAAFFFRASKRLSPQSAKKECYIMYL